VTRDYQDKYERIDGLLGEIPMILASVHADVSAALKRTNRKRKRECRFTSENVLRLAICQVIEGLSLREVVVRVDDSHFLRRFCRFGPERMMSHTLFCSLRNTITVDTWSKVNNLMSEHATAQGWITGEALRVDTTAYETNIHFPTDSALLWDVYRTHARLIEAARRLDPSLAAERRLHVARAKRHYTAIARKVGKNTKAKTLKPQYIKLLRLVDGILEVAGEVANGLRSGSKRPASACKGAIGLELVREIEHYLELGEQVVSQAKRRVVEGEQVANEDKIFSIFEPHTELLKRGKAGKPIEFGHMVMIAQTREKFVTDFGVYETKPVEHTLVDGILERHVERFGCHPETFAADKGFYESAEKLAELGKRVTVVAIGKKGKRSDEETEREHSLAFRLGQAFRAGVEGSIAFLKRCFRMARCFNKGWPHYTATVGATIVAHNLLILARATG